MISLHIKIEQKDGGFEISEIYGQGFPTEEERLFAGCVINAVRNFEKDFRDMIPVVESLIANRNQESNN